MGRDICAFFEQSTISAALAVSVCFISQREKALVFHKGGLCKFWSMWKGKRDELDPLEEKNLMELKTSSSRFLIELRQFSQNNFAIVCLKVCRASVFIADYCERVSSAPEFSSFARPLRPLAHLQLCVCVHAHGCPFADGRKAFSYLAN